MRLSGNGSIRPLESGRCRRWQLIQHVVGADGGRVQRTRTVHGGKRDAQRALDAFRAELSEEVENAETFAGYAKRWLAWKESTGGLSPYSIKNYASQIRVLSTVLGRERMDAITPERCKAALMDLREHGRNGRLSGTTMRVYHTALAMIMGTAAVDGVITRNPMEHVPMPKADAREKTALSSDEMDALWSALLARGVDGRTMAVALALDCGMRLGECVRLASSDVDIEGGVLRVTESKTDSGKGRMLPMTERLRGMCAAWRDVRDRLGIGDAPTWCCMPDGSEMARTSLNGWWRYNRSKLGVSVSYHELRHSNLSKMARFMGAADLKTWAGWSDISLANRYVHDDFSQLRAAVARSQVRNGAFLVHRENHGQKTAL